MSDSSIGLTRHRGQRKEITLSWVVRQGWEGAEAREGMQMWLGRTIGWCGDRSGQSDQSMLLQ